MVPQARGTWHSIGRYEVTQADWTAIIGTLRDGLEPCNECPIARAARPIDRVEDLAGRNVVAWEGAHFDLGEQFAAAVEQAASYRALGNQHGQVQDFLDGSSDVLVIDGLVFRHWARAGGLDPDAFEFHEIFEPITMFRAGFWSETLRDGFDAGLKELRSSGEYQRIVGSYVD